MRYRVKVSIKWGVDILCLTISGLFAILYTMLEPLLVRFSHQQRIFIRQTAKKKRIGEAELVRTAIAFYAKEVLNKELPVIKF